jgi:hypothetical protein
MPEEAAIGATWGVMSTTLTITLDHVGKAAHSLSHGGLR